LGGGKGEVTSDEHNLAIEKVIDELLRGAKEGKISDHNVVLEIDRQKSRTAQAIAPEDGAKRRAHPRKALDWPVQDGGSGSFHSVAVGECTRCATSAQCRQSNTAGGSISLFFSFSRFILGTRNRDGGRKNNLIRK
jgi:hypothetical protein